MPNENVYSGTGYFQDTDALIHAANFQRLAVARGETTPETDEWDSTPALILIGISAAALYMYMRKK